MHVHAAGAASATAFEVLGRRRSADGAPVVLLACRPHTGRQHQIRAHLHHVGLPLVGDKIYGPDELIFDRFTRKALTEADRLTLRLDRQALHAWRLAFPHPRSGEPVAFEAPLAADLQAFWDGCVEPR
jgi:23S rRNA pseudouridine1911/1915/1917 synthase